MIYVSIGKLCFLVYFFVVSSIEDVLFVNGVELVVVIVLFFWLKMGFSDVSFFRVVFLCRLLL